MKTARALVAIACVVVVLLQGCVRGSLRDVAEGAHAYAFVSGQHDAGLDPVRSVDGVRVAQWILFPFAMFGAFWADLFIWAAHYGWYRRYDFDCCAAVIRWVRR
jgi:hypothetical protein